MATKISKGEFPAGHGPDDFVCFGPPAVEDGNFDGCYMADLGCFKQEDVDSNKFYHGAVCQSKKNQKFYTYFEWGRQSGSSDIQFHECSSKDEAQVIFAKQMHDKNDKRGTWKKIGALKVLESKPGKDCYLVRRMAKRTVGLPDAQKIIHDDKLLQNGQAKALPDGVDKTGSQKKVLAAKSKFDAETIRLMKDMNVGAVDFARANIVGGAIPMIAAIEESRDILTEALKRIKKIGSDLNDQINDSQLRQLSYVLYSRVPMTKKVGAPESEWILSQDNIDKWNLNLDAFENASKAIDIGAEDVKRDYDPFEGMPIEMVHASSATREGEFIERWMPKATRNRHSHIYGSMKIVNVWCVRHKELHPRFQTSVSKFEREKIRAKERPLFQPEVRTDLEDAQQKSYGIANVAMLFHGTRSVNVPGILRTGLRMPKELVGIAITGAMFGPGIYWADDWKKSDGYTSRGGGYWSGGAGGVRGRKAFMFVANVALGNPYLAPHSQGYTSPPSGHHCIFGKADHSGVSNNEWIIFQKEQHDLAYLVEYDVK